ncbi:MAG: band 7 protein [Verrucomicrobiales bacterium]|nr:band 7 protein [Verrucomicrobiales bacterium]
MANYYHRIRDRLQIFWHDHTVGICVTAFTFIFLLVYLSRSIFIVIESGQAGVLYRRFWHGTEINKVYGEGLHIIAPFNTMSIYDVRLQQIQHRFSVISSNGLNIGVSVSVRFKPKVELLGVLHKEVGPDYVNKIIIPETQSLIRNVFGQYSPEEIYTTKRSVAQQILQGALNEIGEKYVLLDDLLVESITLPPVIQTAIEEKLIEEQKVLEMKFRIDREKEEAERKLVEARGVNAANTIISESLTDKILRYKGIEATLEFSKSENAKVIVIGGADGLPLIFNPSMLDTATKASPGPVRAK